MDGESVDEIVDGVLKYEDESGSDEGGADDGQDPVVFDVCRGSKQEESDGEEDAAEH